MTMSTATSSSQSGPHKRRVRNFLLDSHFQLKYAGFLVGVAIAISAVLGVVLYTTTRSMISESTKVVEESRKAGEESRKVSAVSRMNVRDLARESPDLVAEFEREAGAYDTAIVEHERAVAAQQESLIRRQHWMIASLVSGLSLMVIMIGLLGIYFTHKVAGPVFKMSRLLTQVGKGNLRVDARLRKGDELQAFFDTFTLMVAGLREVQTKQLRDIEAAIEAIERGNHTDALALLQRSRKTIREAVGD
jgi:nitrogen fixation/metabolism regulation signal transduction histidine kinase